MEESDLFGVFSPNREFGTGLKNIKPMVCRFLGDLRESKDADLTLQLAKVICGHLSACRRPYEIRILFCLVVSHLHDDKDHGKALEIFDLMEKAFGWSFPCAENVRFEKARYLLKHKIFNKEHFTTLQKSFYTQKLAPAMHTPQILQERKMWFARLSGAVGVLCYFHILHSNSIFQKGFKSLSELAAANEQLNEDCEMDLDMAIEKLKEVFADTGENANLISRKECSKLLPYCVDLLYYRHSVKEAISFVKSFLKKHPKDVTSLSLIAKLKAGELIDAPVSH